MKEKKEGAAMKRTAVDSIPGLPDSLRDYIRTAPLYDSSCSPEARVWFADRDEGIFIKTAPKGTLQTEARMTAFYHSKGLGAQVLAYTAQDADWLVTRQIPGEDCTHQTYLDDPRRLSETTGQLLRMLHESDSAGCPVKNINHQLVTGAEKGFSAGTFEADLFPYAASFPGAADAWAAAQPGLSTLKDEVLLHGDYCLPNIMLDNWRFTGFIDLGGGGVGDRHIDLMWGAWTLIFNLKTDKWCSRFLDAYGRDSVEPEKLRLVALLEAFR